MASIRGASREFGIEKNLKRPNEKMSGGEIPNSRPLYRNKPLQARYAPTKKLKESRILE